MYVLQLLLFAVLPASMYTVIPEALIDKHQEMCDLRTKNCKSGQINIVPIVNKNKSSIATESTPIDVKCCGYCSCEDDCFKYGSCCLQMYETYTEGYQTTETTGYRCITPEYVVRKPSEYKTPLSVWLISKCNQDAPNDDVKQQCEHPIPDKSFQSLVPVLDRKDGSHYRNKFCASCNNYGSPMAIQNWNIELVCDRDFSLPEQYILSKMKTNNCSIIFKPPTGSHEEFCVMPPYTIGTCNETGLWPVYDEVVDSACNAFIDPYNLTYKNYFCYACNTAQAVHGDEQCVGLSVEDFTGDITPPFSAILDLGMIERWTKNEILDCFPSKQFEDYKMMKCRDIICYKTRYLSGDICLHDETLDESPCYSVVIRMNSYDNVIIPEPDVQSIDNILHVLYTKNSIFTPIIEQHEFLVETGSQNDTKYIFAYFLLNNAVYNGTDILQNLGTMNSVVAGTYISNVYVRLEFELWLMTATDRGKIRHINIVRHAKQTCIGKEILQFTKIKLCPFLRVGVEELSFEIHNSSLFIPETNTRLSPWEYEIHSDKIYICVEDFENIYSKLSLKNTSREGDLKKLKETNIGAKQLVAFFCVCLSVICLLVTVVTYSVLSELRSQPGINNIILCVCLLLAQTFYQFGAGQGSLPNWACQIIGVICHFFWLSVMFSMNICSVHLFLTFKKSRVMSRSFKGKQICLNVLYIVVGSLMFVGINIVVSLVVSDGQKIGYGGGLCYLSSGLMHLLTFLIPSACLLTSNIVMFTVVVFKISHVSSVTASIKDEKSYLPIYARLSSLTGITWILGFVQILVKNDILEYIFILLNASQGIFIMISFVLNKRIWSLCFGRREKDLQVTSSTKDTKI